MPCTDQLIAIGRRQLVWERQRRCLSNSVQTARHRIDRALGVAEVSRLGLSLHDLAALLSAVELAVVDHADRARVGVSDLDDAASRIEEAAGHIGLALSAAEDADLERVEAA